MGKKTLLYIGHLFHQRTKSTVFLLDLLKERYSVEMCFLDPYDPRTYANLSRISKKYYDVLVCFQVMPEIWELEAVCSFGRRVFFPMADYFLQMTPICNPVWKKYYNFQIISFSKSVHEELLKHGFSSKYIQFFPKPRKVTNWGDPKKIFFWQRCSQINLLKLGIVLNFWNLKKIHLHKAMDPGFEFDPPPAQMRSKMEYSEWYETREEMQKDSDQCALYMAPRFYEGIGMSFLEAMAAGRCVIAPDTTTMNEYITNGKTGLLYHLNTDDFSVNCIPPVDDILTIQKNAWNYIAEGYQKWESEKTKILDWIEEAPELDFVRLSQTFSSCYGEYFAFSRMENGETEACSSIQHFCKKLMFLFRKIWIVIRNKECTFSTVNYRLFGVFPIWTVRHNAMLGKYKVSFFGIPVFQIKRRQK